MSDVRGLLWIYENRLSTRTVEARLGASGGGLVYVGYEGMMAAACRAEGSVNVYLCKESRFLCRVVESDTSNSIDSYVWLLKVRLREHWPFVVK